MKALTVYECEHCKQLFRTPNRHQCKKNPALKNCWTCKNFKGLIVSDDNGDGYYRPIFYVDCKHNNYDLDLEQIKQDDYNLQCEHWEHGKYDWIEHHKGGD